MAYNLEHVSVIIPNWNGKILLERHIPIVLKAIPRAEVILVDDASTDDSVSFIKKNYPKIIIIQKDKQEGFSSTVNEGVKHATRPLLLLLNSDIEPLEGFLTHVFPLFEDPKLFAVGLNDKSIESDNIVRRGRGIAWFSKGMVMHKRGEITASSTAWVSGGSGVFRKELWNILGGLDELYNPFYWEDIDLSYRAVKSGYTIAFESQATVIHKHDEGAIKKSYSPSVIQQIAFRNQLIFTWKNITDLNLIIQHYVWLPYYLLHAIIKRENYIVYGFIEAIKRINLILKSRKKTVKKFVLSDSQLLNNSHHS